MAVVTANVLISCKLDQQAIDLKVSSGILANSDLATAKQLYANEAIHFCGKPVKALGGRIKFTQIYFFRVFSQDEPVQETCFLSVGIEFDRIHTSKYWFDLRVAYGNEFKRKNQSVPLVKQKLNLHPSLKLAHISKKNRRIQKQKGKEKRMRNLIQFQSKNKAYAKPRVDSEDK